MQSIQLSESGIKRLKEALSAAKKCNFSAEPQYLGSRPVVDYYDVRTDGGLFTCCFVSKVELVQADLIKQIEVTLAGDFVMGSMSPLRGKCKRMVTIENHSHVPLRRSDYTTPAQRALERHASRLNSI